MNPITIVLLGEPVPMAHRHTSTGGRRYVPVKPRNASAALTMAAQLAMKESEQEMFTQAVKLELLCEVAIPRSWSKKKQQQAMTGEIHLTTRPDLTNMLKLVEDALKGVVWRDDVLVVEQHCRKVYGVQPKTVLTIRAAD